jgi:hypothetical protein
MTIKENIDKIRFLSTDGRQRESYIRLGGHGIIDGLEGRGTKHDFYKIIGVYDDSILLKQFRGKKTLKLSSYYWDQEYHLIFKKEYDKLEKLW